MFPQNIFQLCTETGFSSVAGCLVAVFSYVVMMRIDGIHRALLLRGVRVLVPLYSAGQTAWYVLPALLYCM